MIKVATLSMIVIDPPWLFHIPGRAVVLSNPLHSVVFLVDLPSSIIRHECEQQPILVGTPFLISSPTEIFQRSRTGVTVSGGLGPRWAPLVGQTTAPSSETTT